METRECLRCKAVQFYTDRILGVYLYQDKVRLLIEYFKYKRIKRLGKFFAQKMYPLTQKIGEIDYLVSLPLHPTRRRERGFSQTEILVSELAHLAGISYLSNTLKRIKNTRSQTDLKKEKRKTNVKDAFWLANPELVEGKKLILIDDIITTGSTFNEAARVLKKAGALKVYGLVIAIAP